nr:alpha/beta hydrolase [Corynebacterium lactis]
MTPDISQPTTPTWEPDILGEHFQHHTIELGEDPDGEGPIRAELVRYTPPDIAPENSPTAPDDESPVADKTAVLWVHGMSDYFFQDHVAQRFAREGYAFYALDLRKCGRAHLPGQTWHSVSDLALYDAELDRSLEIIRAEGHREVVVNAHSTGGLIVALWLDRLRRRGTEETSARVTGAILNSPWLDLQAGPAKVAVYKLATLVMSTLRPDAIIPGQSEGGYGKSLSDEHFGHWSYNTDWKPIMGHDKNWRWFRAVLRGQRRIHRGIEMGVPTLVLHSDASLIGGDYTEEINSVDAVLDTRQIAERTRHLGHLARAVEIPGARHDVYLSRPEPLERAFSETFAFLSTIGR